MPSSHVDRRIRANLIAQLEDALDQSVRNSSGRAANSMQAADNEIARMRRIHSELDKMEEEYEKIKPIRDKVKKIRENVDRLSDRLDRSRPSAHGPAPARRR